MRPRSLVRRCLALLSALSALSACGASPTVAAQPAADVAAASPPEVAPAAPVEPGAPSADRAATTAPSAPVPAALASVIGAWYLDVGGVRAVATFAWEGGALRGSLAREGDDGAAAAQALDELRWDATGALRFAARSVDGARADLARVRVVEGVMTGRVAVGVEPGADPPWSRFATHVTGWNGAWIDRELYPRTWDLLLDGRERATLRIDRAPGALTEYAGTLKVYASVARGIVDEQPERDVEVLRWDGTSLALYTVEGGAQRYLAGEVTGRTIRGTWLTPEATAPREFTGRRRDVLGFGLSPRTAAERDAWQARARRQVAQLVMDGAPRPTSSEALLVGDALPPIAETQRNPTRDDAPDDHPPAYSLRELLISYKLPNPYGEESLSRKVHLWVATPLGAAPAGGWPVAVAANGHWGSARQAFTPDSPYWYGDAFARRGYLVVAVDVSHRPYDDRADRYADLLDGDDPFSGNGTHPAVRAPGMDSDWEEDGERAWDVMRALDYALARPEADPSRAVLVGLSMGGEVVTLAGALDERATAVVPSGFSPDIAVYRYRHHPCWDWAHADVNEYVDVSDYHGLVAPRALLVETGARDLTYSVFAEPFAADKQVLRRARAAWGDSTDRVVHYLHANAHSFQVGMVGGGGLGGTGVTAPLVIAPESPWSVAWQSDDRTRAVSPSLFDALGLLAR